MYVHEHPMSICKIILLTFFISLKAEATSDTQSYDIVLDFLKAAQIEDQLRKTFDQITEEFGGNIKDIKAQLAEEMGEQGMQPHEVTARLRIFEDFHRKMNAAKEPLIRTFLIQLINYYMDNFSDEELLRLTRLFNDPLMRKLQLTSMQFMPETLLKLQTDALELAKPHIIAMQEGMRAMGGAKIEGPAT